MGSSRTVCLVVRSVWSYGLSGRTVCLVVQYICLIVLPSGVLRRGTDLDALDKIGVGRGYVGYWLDQVAEEDVPFGVGEASAGGIFADGVFADVADVGVECVRMHEYETADGRVRNHGAAVKKGYPKFAAFREKSENVSFQRVVRAGCIACRRFDYLDAPAVRCENSFLRCRFWRGGFRKSLS